MTATSMLYLKGIILDGLDGIFKQDLGREGVSVVNNWLPIRSIPAVQLHTAAALQKGTTTISSVQINTHINYPIPSK